MKILSRQALWLLLIPIAFWVSDNFGYAVNHTSSHKSKYFLVKKTKNVAMGDLITFKEPATGIYRDTFTKKVIGVAGDAITVINRDVFINNAYVGTAKEKSKTGKVLHPIKPRVVGKGEYFVFSDSIDSFDSRYEEIGLINESDIYGVAFALI